MTNQNPLIVIVGRTASGKDTLANRIKSSERTLAISHTTRPRRFEGEDTHIFIDNIDGYEDRVLETIINDNHYFLTREDLETHGILVVDPQGVKDLVALKDINRPFSIYYMNVDKRTRRERYIIRANASAEDFEKRDSSEDLQFSEFENSLSDLKDNKRYDVNMLSTDEDIDNVVNKLTEGK